MKAFEEWWYNHIRQHGLNRLNKYHHAKAAYLAGMMRAAEICKSKHENMDSRLNYVAGWLDAEAAIRKEAVDE